MGILIKALITGIGTYGILTIIYLALSYAVFIAKKEFDWGQLLEFLKRKIAVWIGIWILFTGINIFVVWIAQAAGIEIDLSIIGGLTGIVGIIGVLITAALAEKIIEKLKALGIVIQNKNS